MMMKPSARFTPAKRLPWSALPKVLREYKAVPVRFPLPLYHTTLAMPVKGMPGWSARVLILSMPDGTAEIFEPLIHYMVANRTFCATWQNSLARALGLFWDYCQAHAVDGKGARKFDGDLFEDFVLAVRDGTMIEGRDDSGLHWASTSRNQAKLIVSRMQAFATWCEKRGYADVELGVEASSFAPPAGAGKSAAWTRLQKVSVFAHLKAPQPVRLQARNGFGPNTTGAHVQPVKSFPKDRIEDLLEFGHRRPGKPNTPDIHDVYNIRDQMMALLDGWGGLRRSEGLHLWIDDVEFDPETRRARVILGHPVWHKKLWGQDGRTVLLSRMEILNRFYQLQPRNSVTRGRYHVGWKGMALNNKHFDQVHWRDHAKGAKFIELYDIYVSRVRPRIMADRRSKGGYDHPFLFVSDVHSESLEGGIGAPYSMQAYERNHAAAVERIGLEHAKDRGTTTHGLRHMYGRALMRRNLPPQYIKQGLHHCTFLAQAPYTVMDLEETSEVIAKGHAPVMFGDGAIPERHGSRNSQLLGRLADEIRGGPHHA